MKYPMPDEIRLTQEKTCLCLRYGETDYSLSATLLRCRAPDAVNRGRPVSADMLPEDIAVTQVVPVGQYALKIGFSDGHDTGIYDWDLLYTLAAEAAGGL